MPLAVDGKTDHAYPVLRAMCNEMIAAFPKVFEAYQFSSKTVEEHLQKSSKDGTWAETIDIFGCATVLQRKINIYSVKSQKWITFEPRVTTQATITCSRSCPCPFTLILHDLHPIANHFNTLEPEGDCLDPKDLNQAIKRSHLQLHTAEDIISKMNGARYFSKLDASSGYWQIKLDEESSKLCFNSPFGHYKFNRLPFGVSNASEIFQMDIAEIIEGIEGVANAQDDIIVWGDTKEVHDQRLHKVLSRIKDSGLKLNRKKCQFGVAQVTFLGHVLSGEGIYADPRKISAIVDMLVPQNKVELQRFLGMCNYLGKFTPDLANVTAP